MTSTKGYTLDLHGYTVREAVELADKKVREAWENGYDHITLIHGCPDVRHWRQAEEWGRGGIKWELRGYLACGDWKDYVYYRRSKKHKVDGGYMTLAVKPNPTPNVPERWSPVSEGYYH